MWIKYNIIVLKCQSLNTPDTIKASGFAIVWFYIGDFGVLNLVDSLASESDVYLVSSGD